MAYNSHGHTPAGWTTVVIIMVGFVVAGIGVIAMSWQVFWFGGVGLIVLGGIVGKVMQMMGMGQVDRSSESGAAQEHPVAAGTEGRDG